MNFKLSFIPFFFPCLLLVVSLSAQNKWTQLFNARDLSGWQANDPSKFKVEKGILIGFQNDGKGADLRTEKTYSDFELRFTYKMKWPGNSGIWFRQLYQFDLLEMKPMTLSGAFYYPKCSSTFVWTNKDESIEKKNGWNDGQIFACGKRIAFWLNGKKLGDVNLDPSVHRILQDGNIGIQVHGGDAFKGMQVFIASMEIREIEPGTEPSIPSVSTVCKEAPLFQDGDRVALVGGGLIERARLNGYLETAMQITSGVKDLTFRNLGWSGDSVFNDARSYFGQPNEGRQRLARILNDWKPHVIFLNYGGEVALSDGTPWTNEAGFGERSKLSFDDSLSVFEQGYSDLIERVKKASGAQLRTNSYGIVLVTPPPFENLGPPLPDHIDNNRRLERVCQIIQKLAQEKNLRLLDLFAEMGGASSSKKESAKPLTTDGLHFSDFGYEEIARHWSRGLSYPTYQISEKNIQLINDLRRTTVEKNRLFFHRWRPANETYLYLFRKREQGNNAKEIPQFDPLIQEQEKKIQEFLPRLNQSSQG